MLIFSEIADVTISPQGWVNLSILLRGTDEKSVHQIPAGTGVHDFLHVVVGKRARKAGLIVSSKRIIAVVGKKSYDIVIE